ncbi:MAG TPA: protein kinase [Polyangia bacterium]|nr:protein kinase [Polyangia bacterium]
MKFNRDTLLSGRYRIRALLGEGGMGVVYRAFDEQLRRMVAIKTVQGDKASDRDFVKRFRREALAISQIEHPHIVRLLDFMEASGDQPPYMVMELLSGKDMGTVIREEGPLDVTRAVTRTLEASVAIGECHRYGYLHRDVKPNNIFLHVYNQVETAKVLDFGAVKQEERPGTGSEDTAELTRNGTIFGTPYYMPPEQLSGKPATAKSDQYSLGVVLYTALTGRKPFEIEKGREFRDMELLQAIRKGDYTPVQELRRDVPVELAATVHKAISVDPENRFSSLHAFGVALRPYASPQAQLTWEAHFTSSTPLRVTAQVSIAISAGPAASAPNGPISVEPTLPPPEATWGTAPTVVAKRESTIALTTSELRESSQEVHGATFARPSGHPESGGISLVIDEASEAVPGPKPPGAPPAIETTARNPFRNRPALIVGGAGVLLTLVFGAALLITHRAGAGRQPLSPPAALASHSATGGKVPPPQPSAPPRHVGSAAETANTGAATIPSSSPTSRVPMEPAPVSESAPDAALSVKPAPGPSPRHPHKKPKRAAPQFDAHGIAIPTD